MASGSTLIRKVVNPFRDSGAAEPPAATPAGPVSAAALIAEVTADWPDIQAIVDADDGGDYRHLHLYENLTATSEFTLTSTFYQVKTSDGTVYDQLGTVIHTWDPESDINGKYRWAIIYRTNAGVPYADPEAVGYACKGAIAGGYAAVHYDSYFMNWYNLRTCILTMNPGLATGLSNTFNGCASLVVVPNLFASDPGKLISLSQAFYNCTKLRAIADMPIKPTSLSGAFFGCRTLEAIPAFDYSEVTNLGTAFRYCQRITEVPEMNTTAVTDFGSAFSECTALRNVPAWLVIAKANADTRNLFRYCDSLTRAENLDVSSSSNISYMFSDCKALTKVSFINGMSAPAASWMFYNCSALQSLSGLSVAAATSSLSYLLRGCHSLREIEITAGQWAINQSVDINSGTNLDRTTILAIFTDLASVSSKTISISAVMNNRLTDDDRAIATAKGWLVSVSG